MIRVYNCTEEKDRSGHPKKMYVVTGVKTKNAALNEVAKYKKKSLTNIELTHSARVAVVNDDGVFWHGDGERCWAVKLKNEIHE